MEELVQAEKQIPDLKPEDIQSVADILDQVHASLFNELPWHITEIPVFQDCRFEFYTDYRLVFITSEGLALEMDHRQNDTNYFHTDEPEIAFDELSELDPDYISKQKAKDFATYGKVGLFQAVWPNLIEKLGPLKKGEGILRKGR